MYLSMYIYINADNPCIFCNHIIYFLMIKLQIIISTRTLADFFYEFHAYI